ncbi:carboxymethylenebutenolidase [Mycobacterium sp. IEC1808]|uniref:dienelactone hydrolase family protein n=1 Tax=Mycobacterium sp. IEC1808 TaxID=1743230 RepID=UPI000A1573C8|nr:dienelactone hydrolase family protein [Mycobacterium sp. IEC1808]ORW85242.1 carboxymethylenebutenolidase [Mycobacterium sp. IEC1808]
MGDITYPVADGHLPGYLAVPEGPGPWPGVVVVQDLLGMTANLRQISDRLARSGYLALAPVLYGRGPKIRCLLSTIRAHVTGRGPAHDDLVAARDHLVADERCSGKVGLVGFCIGAGFVMQLAPRGEFDAAAPNYGLLPGDVEALRESCPVVASFGANDPIVRRGTAARLEAVLAEGDVPRDIKEYPDVGHSFINDHCVPAPIRIIAGLAGMAYSESESEDAWRRIVTFFNEHLQ